MQKYLKSIYAAAIAGLGSASAVLAADHGHIGWQSGIVVAITTLSALGGVWGVSNVSAPSA
jgi:hypothetical protein